MSIRLTTVSRRITFRIPILVTLFGMLTACVTYEYHETRNTELSRLDSEEVLSQSEAELLDVGVVLFDPGLAELDDDSAAYSSVRQSEAVWFANQLKAALDYSNAWGSVRTLPSNEAIADVIVEGIIVDSNGEQVLIELSVYDSTGKLWFEKPYAQQASSYSYNPEVNSNRDPFQAMFADMANDMFDYRAAMNSANLLNIRNVSKVRFAETIIPDAYGSYIEQQEGSYNLVREPAANDPLIARIDRLRSRNDLFLDVIQDYYRGFNGQMAHPYQEWRKATYKAVIVDRQLRKKSKQEKIAGIATLVGGVLLQHSSGNRYGSAAGWLGSIYGANLFRHGYQTEIEAEMNTQALRELSNSLELALEPSVFDLQERSVTLTGTVEDQFDEWKRILRDIYYAENGLENPDKLQPVDDEASSPNLSADGSKDEAG